MSKATCKRSNTGYKMCFVAKIFVTSSILKTGYTIEVNIILLHYIIETYVENPTYK